MKICVDCNYHEKGKTDIWFDQFCLCPEVRREEAIDPVSGETGFMGRNDLGGTYITDYPYPFCRDINKGDCEHFEYKMKK
jgi:hypothetical protein